MTVQRNNWADWEAEQQASRRGLARTARAAAGPWIASLARWDLFGTFTYDPTRVKGGAAGAEKRVTTWKAQRDARKFFRDGGRVLGRPLVGIMAVELHKSGSAHMHGLFDVGGVAMGDIERLWRPWFAANGFIRLEVPRSTEHVVNYCAKYLAKEWGELVISRELMQSRMKLGRGRLSAP